MVEEQDQKDCIKVSDNLEGKTEKKDVIEN